LGHGVYTVNEKKRPSTITREIKTNIKKNVIVTKIILIPTLIETIYYNYELYQLKLTSQGRHL
jgi:ribosomal protein L31E